MAYIVAMKAGFWQDKHKIYCVGIGGISMSGLALHLQALGFSVSGSDAAAAETTALLENAGIPVFSGADAARVEGADAVVYTSAIPAGHPELARARECGIPVYERAELLSLVASDYENVIGVAGCHGKTTATAMCAHVLDVCSGSCSAHIGGLDAEYGNFYEGGQKYFVTEACEYRAHFLQLKPDLAVFLNTGEDHLDYYGSREALVRANEAFLSSARGRIVWGEDALAARVRPDLTFGFSPQSDVRAVGIRGVRGMYSFSLCVRGALRTRVRLRAYGRHNILNALAAAAVAEYYGYPAECAAEGLRRFRAIRRRFESLGELGGAAVIADYAHHPSEIAAAVRTAREICRGRLFVVFQPHTYSRTRTLFDSFVSVLSGLENLVVFKTFAAREYFDAAGSALTLSQHLPNSLYVESVRELDAYLRRSLRPGDVALVLGAGDIYYAVKRILQERPKIG